MNLTVYAKFRISPTYLSQLIKNQKMLNSFTTHRPTDKNVKGVGSYRHFKSESPGLGTLSTERLLLDLSQSRLLIDQAYF